eukprot:TRINITY_DN59403_c0_g1_i1.p1 TRINITY_DN59403_c0_g1~~TRINITY_DN59403_c0_g1_i1.p1  ORF type:complete len:890 (+),score=105.39 TRINITY_DN59403_c0_g1_i1:228-2672(+)
MEEMNNSRMSRIMAEQNKQGEYYNYFLTTAPTNRDEKEQLLGAVSSRVSNNPMAAGTPTGYPDVYPGLPPPVPTGIPPAAASTVPSGGMLPGSVVSGPAGVATPGVGSPRKPQRPLPPLSPRPGAAPPVRAASPMRALPPPASQRSPSPIQVRSPSPFNSGAAPIPVSNSFNSGLAMSSAGLAMNPGMMNATSAAFVDTAPPMDVRAVSPMMRSSTPVNFVDPAPIITTNDPMFQMGGMMSPSPVVINEANIVPPARSFTPTPIAGTGFEFRSSSPAPFQEVVINQEPMVQYSTPMVAQQVAAPLEMPFVQPTGIIGEQVIVNAADPVMQYTSGMGVPVSTSSVLTSTVPLPMVPNSAAQFVSAAPPFGSHVASGPMVVTDLGSVGPQYTSGPVYTLPPHQPLEQQFQVQPQHGGQQEPPPRPSSPHDSTRPSTPEELADHRGELVETDIQDVEKVRRERDMYKSKLYDTQREYASEVEELRREVQNGTEQIQALRLEASQSGAQPTKRENDDLRRQLFLLHQQTESIKHQLTAATTEIDRLRGGHSSGVPTAAPPNVTPAAIMPPKEGGTQPADPTTNTTTTLPAVVSHQQQQQQPNVAYMRRGQGGETEEVSRVVHQTRAQYQAVHQTQYSNTPPYPVHMQVPDNSQLSRLSPDIDTDATTTTGSASSSSASTTGSVSMRSESEQGSERSSKLKARGEVRPAVGVEVQFVDDAAGGKKTMAQVLAVVPSSPADEAGIMPDDILSSWNGTLLDSKDKLERCVNGSKLGSIVTLDVIRSARRIQIAIRIAGTTRSQSRTRRVTNNQQAEEVHNF